MNSILSYMHVDS